MNTNIKTRTYNISASEVAGLLKEYSQNLLKDSVIDKETYDKLQNMPSYLDTAYSINKKLKFTAEEKELFREFAFKPIFKRGLDVEPMIKDIYLSENSERKVVAEQVRVVKEVEGSIFPIVAVIDYMLDNGVILETKSSDANPYLWGQVLLGLNFSYYIQVQAQLWLHNCNNAIIYYGAVVTTKNEGEDDSYYINDTIAYDVSIDHQIINAIKQCMIWFSYQYNKGVLDEKDEEKKVAKDKLVDDFLQREQETIDIEDDNIENKILKLKELKKIVKEHDLLEKEIKESIKQKMQGYKRARLVGNKIKASAFFSNTSFYEEEDKLNLIQKAQEINVGEIKSVSKFFLKL